MTATKSERLINLMILLLVSRTYVSKERIRDALEEYRTSPSDDAFEKMFERDKEELRALGIPVEVGFIDKFFEDEHGYRIKRDAFELPEIDLTPDEVAVLGLAARVWQHAGLAASTSQALVKLRAAGHQVDRDVLASVQPSLQTDDAAFDPLLEATLTHTPVSFGYRRPGAAEPVRRHLQPWGVVTAQERWYVVGLDTDRGEPRMFRLSRITGEISHDGQAGSYTVPVGTDIRALSRSLAPAEPTVVAQVLARTGTARGLRRRADTIESDVEPGFDRLTLHAQSVEQLTSSVLGFGDAVVVESPEELRTAVRERLAAFLSGVA